MQDRELTLRYWTENVLRSAQQPHANLLTVMHKHSSYNPPSVHISVMCTQNIMHSGDKHELSPSSVQIYFYSLKPLF